MFRGACMLHLISTGLRRSGWAASCTVVGAAATRFRRARDQERKIDSTKYWIAENSRSS